MGYNEGEPKYTKRRSCYEERKKKKNIAYYGKADLHQLPRID